MVVCRREHRRIWGSAAADAQSKRPMRLKSTETRTAPRAPAGDRLNPTL